MKGLFSRAPGPSQGLAARLVQDPPSQTSRSEDLRRPAAFETEEDDLAAPGVTVKKPSMPLRNSVLLMEPSRRRKACGIFTVLAVSFLFMFCTPIYVIEKLRLIPPRPSLANLKSKLNLYQEYTNRTNAVLGVQMYAIYNQSVIDQQVDCEQRLEYIFTEESAVRNRSSKFVNSYCKDVADRVYRTGYRLANLTSAQINSLPQCNNFYLTQKRKPSDYLNWIVKLDEQSSRACTDTFMQNNISYCLVSVYLQKNPYVCFDGYEWDKYVNFYTNDESTNRRCSEVEATMKAKFKKTVEEKALGFKESINKRFSYDNDYFFGGAIKFGNIYDYVKNIQNDFPRIENQLEVFHNRLETNSKMMALMYDIYKKSLPADLENIFKLDPPDLSYPPYPTELVEEIRDIMNTMEEISDQFQTYNPPIVVYPETDNVFDFSFPDVKFVTADIDFKASSLLDDISETWNVLLTFVSAFQVTDFLIRFCLWLNDVAFILYEQRRDMTSLKTRTRNYCALFLENLTILVYIIVVLIVAVAISVQNLDISKTIRDETYVACNNEIVVKNSEILVEYQNDAAKLRVECNAGLATENSKLQDVNNVFVDDFKALYVPFESLYNATQMTSNITLISKDGPGTPGGRVTLNLTRMFLPANDLKRGVPVDLQPPTSIEQFAILPSLCTNSTEAAELAVAVDQTVNAFIDYTVAVLIVALGMIIAFRMFVAGLQFFFWMEITQGYMFDEEFTSATLKSRVRSNRIKGIAFMVLSAVSVIVVVSVFAKP